jgi:peroxiredoxin
MTALVFGTVLPWLLIGVGTWLGFQLVRQNGRLLLRLETIEKLLAPRAAAKPREAGGLPIGMAAPDFELPDLTGVRHKLSDFRERNLLLIFFNPQCGYCTKMAPDLAALPEGGGDLPVPVVVSTGDAHENRKLVEQYGIRCLVLRQEEMEIASKFHAQGTPMGYRIDKAGRIASELTVGAEPLLQLAATIVADHNSAAVPKNGSAPSEGKGDSSLARSRLNRTGLKAGVTAPDFELPRLGGGELSLAELRGGRVLLVFSDPDCGPCDELAPRLQEIHLRRPDLQVLVVSRRDVEANRAKVAALGLTFPIVLQRHWEISLQYAMFATPVGYLIDEQGILASDVAVGVGPILALVHEPARQSHDGAESFAPRNMYARANGK